MDGSKAERPSPRRTNVLFYPEDQEAIETIQRLYGLSTDSDAVRLALRIFAKGRVVLLTDTLGGGPELDDVRLEDVQIGRNL